MTLEQYIEQNILPQYDAFDGGHRRDHALTVIAESIKLAREHHADERMAYAIAAYHDLGLRIDREHHHIHSGEILMDGMIYIIRDGKIYNAQGVEVK